MTVITTPKGAPAKSVVKDDSMLKQKEMMASHFERLTSASETGAKVCNTFVPGNLNELHHVLRPPEQPAGGQRHAERPAQQVGRLCAWKPRRSAIPRTSAPM